MNKRLPIIVFAIALFTASDCTAADWPQFRGPRRDGKSDDTGLLKKWPQAGPKQLWSVDGLGAGYSSAAIADGLVYTTGKIGPAGYLFCFDLNGKPQWKVPYGPEYTKSYPAARTTPTITGGKLYLFSGMGVATCFDAKTGNEIWSRDVFAEFDGQWPRWGMSECLLIDGEKVIATPGGKKASIVALDKNTGKVIWASNELTQPSTYSNPIAIEYKGNRMIIQMLRDCVAAIDPKTGKLLWRDNFDDYHLDRKRLVNANVPTYFDGRIHTTSGYDNGGAMVQIFADPTKVERLWVDRTLDIHHGGEVLIDGYIYGANFTSFTSGKQVCLEWTTGKVMYETPWLGNKGSTIYADGMLYCYEEDTGYVGIAPATLNGFKAVSAFKIEVGKGKHWAHPAISDARLYIRHEDFLMAYDIAKK